MSVRKSISSSEEEESSNFIVMCSQPYPQGMAATQRIQHYIDAIRGENVIVHVLITAFPKWPGQQTKGNHKEVEFQCLSNGQKSLLLDLLLIPWKVLQGCRLLKKWKTGGKNALFIYDGITLENLPLVLFARILRYKVVIDLVEDYSLELENQSWARKLKLESQILIERFLPQLIHGLVVISTHLKSRFKYVQAKGIPMVLIPISADIIPDTGRGEIGENTPMKFIYSGSFGKKDNVDALIMAFNNLAEDYQDCELLLSGRGREVDQLMDLATTSRIKYVGYLDKESFDEFLRKGNAMCMIRSKSKYANAGFPFKLGEYLATGKPVIASNVGDVSHYLVHKRDALLVEPENIDSLTEAMEYVMSNNEEMIEMGKSGQQKCLQHFNAKKNGQMLVNLFESLFDKP